MRWPVFFAAPHRMMFLTGTVQALAVMAFWSIEVGAQYAGLWPAPAWPLLSMFPAPLLHAMLISCGVFPLFIFGFILTAGPRWQGVGDLPPRDFIPAFLLLAGGWLLVWAALLLPKLLVAGLALALGGWISVALTLTRIARFRATEREHIVYVALAAWLGAAALGAFLAFAAGAAMPWARLGISLSVWGFLLPVFITVAHRMLPFFTSSAVRGYVVQRPAWALRVLLGAGVAHGALTVFGQPQWLWLADLPAMLAAGRLSWLWWSRAAIDNRMLAVLHVAFAWLAPAFALFALQSLLWPALPGLLGQAPLHALTLGFFASMLLGMASRVTLGHSGQAVAADEVMWRAFCMMQGAAVLRVVSELPALPGAQIVMWLSSMLWLGAFALWAARYAPAFWRPRSDGRPG
ncbi:MAG: NnrS family protein [Sulfuritalea sp.]|nr:NnrS family protein [Sulfuritalea sp.]MDP1984244.1 NnrS family protein [Sulfuritalea sp.]